MEQKSRIHRIERNIFRLGVLLLIGEAMFLVVVAAVRPVLFGKMVALISAILVGGRLASIPAGLAIGFRPVELICFLSSFNLMWLLLSYSLVIKLSDRVTNGSLVRRMIQGTHEIADKQKSKVGQFGTLGLAIFVWLPFPWTGSVVGAVIGLLMGLSTGRIMLVVIPSMLVAISTWTLGFKYLFDEVAQLQKWFSAALAASIILLALLLRFHRLHRREGNQN